MRLVTAMGNFAYRVLGDCLIAVSGPGGLPAADFETFLAQLDREETKRYLSMSTGTTSVTRKQRQLTAEVLRRRKTKIAMINESRVTMGIVAAARFLGMVDIRVFGLSEKEKAVDHLGLSSERKAVLDALQECLQELPKRKS